MTNKDLVKVTMQAIEFQCKNCHEMLVDGLISLYEVKNSNLSILARKAKELKADPKDIHNYDPKRAYQQNALTKKVFGGEFLRH